MSKGKEDETAETSASTQATTSAEGEKKDSQSADAWSHEKALEHLKQVRADRQAAATDAASTSGRETAKSGAAEKSAANDDAAANAGEDRDGEEKKTESKVFSAEDFEKPGFFDRLSKEEWKALEAQHPEIVRSYKAAQAELSRRGRALAEKERALEKREKTTTKSNSKTTSEDNSDEQDKDLEALGYTQEDAKKLFGSKSGRAVIREEAQAMLREMGFDPERTNAQESGFDLAFKAFPQLAEDEVWTAVQRVIAEDDDELDALETSNNPREIARILKSAAGRVVADRQSKTSAKTSVDEKTRAKETKNATQPGSKAAGAARNKSGSNATGKLSMKEELLEFVKDHKATAGYKELGR